ncbi:putative reverse transcriptase domain-containing protein [Tanacetum coccineum]
MPPRRSSATARAAAAATPMTAAAVEQLIEARVSAALANHETLRNSTNGHGDGSHNSDTRIRGTVRTPRECTYKDFLNCKPLTFKGTEGVVVLSQWFEKMESVFHISNCAVENQVKFATCTFLGNALTWWNSHMKTVTQDVAYAMDWKALKKMMTVKYCPRGEIKKLEIELWNLKVKGTDVASYTLRFQELALMCGRMFHEESEEVEKYVGGLPDMIRGNVMSYQPKTMEKAIEFANDQMDQKVLTITERQAEQKRKLEFNAGNNQGHQQQNKRQNTGRAYTAGPGEKREYTGSLPLCTKCNYHHKGQVIPGVISARRSAIWLVIVGVLVLMVIITIVGTLEQLRILALTMSVVFRGISREILKVERIKYHSNQGGNGKIFFYPQRKCTVVGTIRGQNQTPHVVSGFVPSNNARLIFLLIIGADRSLYSVLTLAPILISHQLH